MNDTQLIEIFAPIIDAQLVADGYTGVTVMQNNQPTQQGALLTPTVYFSKIADHRYGFPRKEDVWDPDAKIMVHTEVEQYETTFQFGAMVRSDPATPNQYTAADLINEVTYILQSDSTIATLNASNVGVLRITDIRTIYYTDDRDQFQQWPTFDVIFTHAQTRISAQPVIELINLDIKRV